MCVSAGCAGARLLVLSIVSGMRIVNVVIVISGSVIVIVVVCDCYCSS